MTRSLRLSRSRTRAAEKMKMCVRTPSFAASLQTVSSVLYQARAALEAGSWAARCALWTQRSGKFRWAGCPRNLGAQLPPSMIAGLAPSCHRGKCCAQALTLCRGGRFRVRSAPQIRCRCVCAQRTRHRFQRKLRTMQPCVPARFRVPGQQHDKIQVFDVMVPCEWAARLAVCKRRHSLLIRRKPVLQHICQRSCVLRHRQQMYQMNGRRRTSVRCCSAVVSRRRVL
jgi:hypothetical protein